MADFKTHISVAAGASFVAGLSAYTLGMATIPQTLFIIMLGGIGGILPDIDSPHSTSKEWVFSILGATTALIFMFSLIVELGILLSVFLSICIYIAIVKYLKDMLGKFCVHRGVIHSLPVGLIFASVIVILVNVITNELIFAWLSGLFLCFGFLIHLLLDECYSVDLSGAKLKKSFGTALSIFSHKNFMAYLIAYGLLVGLFFLLPKDNLTPLLQSKLIMKNILANLLPAKLSV